MSKSDPLPATPCAEQTPEPKFWFYLSGLVWGLPLLIITVMVTLKPLHRTVTPVYHEAAAHWWHHEPMESMLYFPQFAVLFSPFHFLPLVAGEILWRWIGVAGLVWGLTRLLRASFPEFNWRLFALVSLTILPVVLGAVRTGQANVHLGAALLLAVAFLKTRQWNWAALFLALAVGIKPLGLAAVGLAFAGFSLLRWRLLAGLALLVVFPFLFGPPAYVKDSLVASVNLLRKIDAAAQHRFATDSAAAPDVSRSTDAVGQRFADLNGLLGQLRCPLIGAAASYARVVVGGSLFALMLVMNLRGASTGGRVLAWYMASVLYLMLFNPMTETNSYVIFAPAVGWWIWISVRAGERRLAWMLALLPISMGLLRNILRPWLGGEGSNTFANAWFPAMAVLFTVLVIWKWPLWAKVSSPEKQ